MSVTPENRKLVIPGELLAEGDFIVGENVYREGNQLYSQKIGLVFVEGKTVNVVALRGKYIPKVGDVVIGQVVDTSMGGWTLDIRSCYDGTLSVSDVTGRSFGPGLESLTSILGIGEIVVGQIVAFDRARGPSITIQGPGFGRVEGGVVISIKPTRIRRVIGKKGSMINMINQESGCDILVGQNGKILIRGRDPKSIELVVKVVKLIEEEAHISGLTDKVKELIRNEKMRDKS